MTTTSTPPRARERGPRSAPAPFETRPPDPTRRRHLLWLAAGFPFAFAVPFVLADTLALDRDLFYGLYALAVALFVGAWARDTGLGRPELTRNWRWGLALGALAAAVLALVVVRTEDATDRPEGLELLGALLWRGVVYGATDGVLLSVFPILAVFGAFAGTRLLSRLRGTIAVGAVALVASLGVTVSYHLGYSDFRSAKVGKTAAGDLIWSAPTLLTLSPLGAPLAHVGLHVTAVVHSYDTDLFLPPHAVAEPAAVPAEGQTATAYFFRGEQLAPAARALPDGSAAATLRALLEGPTAEELETGLTSNIPTGTRLRSVSVAGGTATVDLTEAFAAGGGSLSMAGRLAQVTYTLTELPQVERVVYLLGGEPLTALGGEGLLVDGPQTRAVYEGAAPGSLEASLLGPVLVETPAQGSPFASPLRVTGTATHAFELVVVDGDGRIVVEEPVAAGAGGRSSFDVTLSFDPGSDARGTLAVHVSDRSVAEIPLAGRAPPGERSAFADTLTALTTGAGRIAPGATAYVRGPSGTWFGAAGIADLATRRAMRPGDRMRLESVSKVWTAAIVLRLAEDGRLRPSDTVERWLPGLLPDGGRITVAQLLTHTSGLIDNNDMVTDPERFIARVGDARLRAQLTAVAERARTDPALEYPPLLWIRLAAWQPLRFEPGTDTHYSNIGFEVLGLIAERAGGATVAELYDSVLIGPLGLASAAYDPQGQITGPHARGYRMTGEQADATAWHGGIGAEGGVVASAGDTGRLLEALLGGRVLADEWVRRLRGDLFWRGGTPSSCGGPAYGHSGGGAGYKAEALVSADGRWVAVLLLNGRGSPADDSRA
ncbi:MAG TPA: serine hydrolase, partial [Gaiellaceae bacterium]|nr:serine hydrolase [Gaiellaceae bacterium]